MSENKPLRVQVAFEPDYAARIRELADQEHRPIRFQVEALALEALRARQADRAASDKEVSNVR
jgi:hypothetical protein